MIFETIPHPLPDPTEKPLIFYSSPRTLQEMACSQSALLCWNRTYSVHYVYNLYPDETADAYWFISCKCINSGDIFHLPKPIGELIDGQMESIGSMLFRWAQHFFGRNCRENVLNCFDSIVLDPSGEICYKSTAKNLLKCDKLNLVEKYRIACWCGFEKDIELLWPLVRNDARVEDCDLDRQPTMFYWNCRMRNELHKIPGDESDSPEWRMILSNGLYFWSEMEYFWNKLTSREQTLQFFKIPEGLSFISKYLVPKLSQSQLSYILKDIPSVMVVNLAIEGEGLEYAWQTWNYVKSSISSRQFYDILHSLWNYAFDGEWTNANNIAGFLYEVWISASDNLREWVVDRHVEIFVDMLDSDRVIEYYGCDMRFLLQLFVKMTMKMRKKTWFRNWCKLIILAKPSDLGKFMALCFDDLDSMVHFKRTIMIDYVMLDCEFDSFVRRGLCDELVEYFNFCCSDEEIVRRLKIQIVESNMKNVFHCFDLEAFVKFNQFIDGSFRSIDQARRFKESFILENVHIWYDLLDNGWLIDVKNTIDCLSSEPKFLIKIKRLLFEHWKCILRSGSFTRFYLREWKEFLEWCTSNDREIITLKNSLNVDFILEVLLPDCIRDEMILPPYFSCLDSFLRWYFVTEEATKKYKLGKINSYQYHDDDVISRVLRGGNDDEICRMLYWFFDYDLVAAKNFRTKIFNT